MLDTYFVGVDVGTSSVRAALVTKTGHMVTTATHPIEIFEPQPDFYEQSSDNIWEGCCKVIQLVTSGVDKGKVKGIGFDATCSLVALNKDFQPISLSPTGKANWNVVMWMDHRAAEQAAAIDATGHQVLKFTGGSMSVEMQSPKLMWLKQNLQESWSNVHHFFDLPDFLTWCATGNRTRSLCSLVCKWAYEADDKETSQWCDDFLQQIGLDNLIHDDHAKIGSKVQAPGEPCGSGLSVEIAERLGLQPGTPVATSMVDAHAGAVGCLGCSAVDSDDLVDLALTSRLALICGTSTCHMALSEKALFVPGVWGPYYSTVVPGLWLNEGGQSATGKLLDHLVTNHKAYPWIKQDADIRNVHDHVILNEVLDFMAKRDHVRDISELTNHLHVWPDFHGNRSPLADPMLRGMVCGLTLSLGVEDLAVLYLAAVQALAYGTRQIIECTTRAGHHLELLIACGGLAKNPVFVQAHADVTGLPIVLPHATESVLLGSAMLGARASGEFTSVQAAMKGMGGRGQVVTPDGKMKKYHEKKYKVFLSMLDHQRMYQNIMDHDL